MDNSVMNLTSEALQTIIAENIACYDSRIKNITDNGDGNLKLVFTDEFVFEKVHSETHILFTLISPDGRVDMFQYNKDDIYYPFAMIKFNDTINTRIWAEKNLAAEEKLRQENAAVLIKRPHIPKPVIEIKRPVIPNPTPAGKFEIPKIEWNIQPEYIEQEQKTVLPVFPSVTDIEPQQWPKQSNS
jgi:hypothetical protein